MNISCQMVTDKTTLSTALRLQITRFGRPVLNKPHIILRWTNFSMAAHQNVVLL